MITKYKYGLIGIALILMLGNVVHAQTQTGYRVPARVDVGGGRMTGDMWCQYGTNGVRFKIGTQTVTQVGTAGVINSTNATSLPSLDFTYSGGSLSANFDGFNAVYVAGSQVGTSGALTGKLDAVGGVGTNNTFNNPTLAGLGIITASFGANGLVISPAEYSMLDGATIPLNTATGSITNHTHTGSDGTTQVSHTNLTSKGTQTHTQIDDFIASKAAASGVASLDANTLVVQNPSSGTSTPGISKIPISLGTGFLNDSWLSSVISKLGQTIEIGTETTGNTDNVSEGSTNKYYTDARVNTVIGSSSITSPQVSPRITFTSPANGQFLKIVDVQGNIENGTSSVSADFSAVTGSLTPTQLPDLIRLPGTTTAQIASNDLILYNYATSTSDRNTKSLLACNNAGTSTFVDTSGYGQIVVANGNIIGTSTSKYGSGAALFDGTTDFLTVGTNTDWAFLHKGTSTVEKWIKPDDFATNYLLYNTWDGNGTTVGVAAYITTARNIHLWNHKNGAYCLNVDTGGTYPNDTTDYHHVRVVSDYSLPSNQVIVYVDGVSIGTLTVTAAVDTGNPVEALSFGKSIGGEPAFKGLQDSMMVTNTALCSTNFTSPTQEAAVNIFYTQYQTRFQSPVDGNIPFQIITHGTATAYVPVVAFNATHTIFGSSTSIYSPVGQSGGTTTVYTIDASNRNVLGVYYTPSEEILKVVHTPEKVNRIEEMKRLRLGEWSWQIRDVNRLDAEASAKEEFVKVKLNEQDYEIAVNYNGSITVTIDAERMESDYELAKMEKELEWAYTLEQVSLIDSKEEEMESGQERYTTPFAGDPTTPDILQSKDKRSLCLNNQVGYAYETIKELIAMIGSLTTRVEILENK